MDETPAGVQTELYQLRPVIVSHAPVILVLTSCSCGVSGGSGQDEAWYRPGAGGGPLSLIVSLLTASPLSLDLGAHVDLLQLTGTLFAGLMSRQHFAATLTNEIHCGVYRTPFMGYSIGGWFCCLS